jgi:hypothetical protein
MSFVLETIVKPSRKELTKLVKYFQLSNHKKSACYEKNKSEIVEKDLLDNIVIRALENKTRLHILYDERTKESIPCGLIALNFETVGEFSSLSVDLLFISKQYRGLYFYEINSKISYFLLDFALQEATDMNQISKLDAVLLTPINNCVKNVYIQYGFQEFDDDWLYILVDN